MSEQTTFVYCPNCKHELCTTGALLSDNDQGVAYRCEYCNGVTLWNFDAPTPLLIKTLKSPAIIMDYRSA